MRFHIVGMGAIGSLVAHHLRTILPVGHNITLVSRAKRLVTLQRRANIVRVENNGIVSSTTGFESEVFDRPEELRAGIPKRTPILDEGPVDKTPETPSTLLPIESLIITTKAHSTLSVVKRMLPRLSPASTIVLLQNGMGIYEELIREVFRNPETRPQFILASNTHGAWVKNFHQVVHTGIGDIRFGIVPDPRGRDFEAAMKDESIPLRDRRLKFDDIGTRDEDPSMTGYRSLRLTVAALSALEHLDAKWLPISEIQLAMRKKVVVNSIINPLTAIMNCRNGDLFREDASLRIAKKICREASFAFAKEMQHGAQTMLEELNDPENTEQVPVGRLPRALEAPYLEKEVIRVAESTGSNFSSMLQDIRKGNLTEIDHLNGYLVRLGSMYHVHMPYTIMLADMVKMRHAIPFDQL